MNEIKKKCTKCSEEKNIELFYSGRAECKDCSKAKRKES
jgi:hypothetical protein